MLLKVIAPRGLHHQRQQWWSWYQFTNIIHDLLCKTGDQEHKLIGCVRWSYVDHRRWYWYRFTNIIPRLLYNTRINNTISFNRCLQCNIYIYTGICLSALVVFHILCTRWPITISPIICRTHFSNHKTHCLFMVSNSLPKYVILQLSLTHSPRSIQ